MTIINPVLSAVMLSFIMLSAANIQVMLSIIMSSVAIIQVMLRVIMPSVAIIQVMLSVIMLKVVASLRLPKNKLVRSSTKANLALRHVFLSNLLLKLLSKFIYEKPLRHLICRPDRKVSPLTFPLFKVNAKKVSNLINVHYFRMNRLDQKRWKDGERERCYKTFFRLHRHWGQIS